MCVKFAQLRLPDAGWFAVLFFAWIVAWSLIFAHVDAPATYFSDFRSPLNLFLVKPSLYISCAALLFFVFVAHYPLNNGRLRPTLLPIYRLVFGLALYRCMLALCRLVGQKYAIGAYSLECRPDGADCRRQLERWFPVTVSGHVFTVFGALLMVLEEAAVVRQWRAVQRALSATDEAQCCAVDVLDDSKIVSRRLLLRYAPYVRCAYALLVVWCLFLAAAAFAALAYARQPPEKIAGAVCALLHWQLTYRFCCFSAAIADAVDKFEHKSVTRYRTVDYDLSDRA